MNLKCLLLIFLISVISNKGLNACSCIGQSTVKSAVKNSKFVLKGEILAKEIVTVFDSSYVKMFPNDTSINMAIFEQRIAKYKMKVEIVYKGKITKEEIEIYTGLGGGDCGNRFKIGDKYIIYGSKKTHFGTENNEINFPKGKNIVWTNICTRTQTSNQKELEQIQKFAKKKRKKNKN